jgi:hypothetical protein
MTTFVVSQPFDRKKSKGWGTEVSFGKPGLHGNYD